MLLGGGGMRGGGGRTIVGGRVLSTGCGAIVGPNDCVCCRVAISGVATPDLVDSIDFLRSKSFVSDENRIGRTGVVPRVAVESRYDVLGVAMGDAGAVDGGGGVTNWNC